MNRYRISEVAGPMSPVYEVEAHTANQAVAEHAGCQFTQVCLPIWRKPAQRWHQDMHECYMPLDDTGRQWLLTRILT